MTSTSGFWLHRNAVDGDSGYWIGPLLTEAELGQVRKMIREMFLARIIGFAPRAYDQMAEIDLSHYHRHADCLDHAATWPRNARLFHPEAIDFIRSSSLFRHIEAAFGRAIITNEVEGAAPEIVWRLVRPNRNEDVGPIHADSWFWEMNRWKVPFQCRRIKVWTMICGEIGRAGLSVIPGSHRAGSWLHGMERRQGLLKPVFDETVLGAQRPVLLETKPGTSVVFHDALLHGGAVTGGNQSRVSFEFTIFVPSS